MLRTIYVNKHSEICKVCGTLESLILDKKAKQLISIGQCNHVVPHRWVKLKMIYVYFRNLCTWSVNHTFLGGFWALPNVWICVHRSQNLISAFAILGAQHHLAAGQLLAGIPPQRQQCLGDDGHGNQMKSWPIIYIPNTNASQMQKHINYKHLSNLKIS